MNKVKVFSDITIVTPVYNKYKYVLFYLKKITSLDIETLLISDGYDENLLREIKKYISNYRLENVRILEYQPHQGVAYAKSLGIKNVKTNTFVFCDDDDYFEDFILFYNEVKSVNSKEIIFFTMPEVVAFNESFLKKQYDRSSFHNTKGCELLEYIVRTGEMHALCAGSCFRTSEVISLLPEPFFQVSEDFVLLTRLCAYYPHRKIYVTKHGRYMRRIHSQSLSNPSQITPEKMLMHIVSLTVGGYYLEKMGRIDRAEFIRILLNRGKLLQGIYGFGLQTAALVGGLLLDRPPDPKAAEAVHALNYLRAHRDVLPPELMAMLSDAGKSMLMAS